MLGRRPLAAGPLSAIPYATGSPAIAASLACGTTITAGLSTATPLACAISCVVGTPRNFTLQSEDFSTSWTKLRLNVTTDATTAPDGTTTADKLTETATSGVHWIGQADILQAPTGQNIFAVCVKAAERSWIKMTDGLTGTNYAYYDLTNGITGTIIGAATATITAIGNGWYRCTFKVNTWDNPNILISVATADNTDSYAGTSGNGVYVWGAQSEPGATIGPYIKTTTAVNGSRILNTGIQLGAAVACVTAVTAGFGADTALAASIACLSSVLSAGLTTQIKVASALAGVVASGADLSTQIKAQTSISAQSSLSASLTTGIALAGSMAVVSTQTGVLTTAIRLAGALSSTSTVSASLSTAIRLVSGETLAVEDFAGITSGVSLSTYSSNWTTFFNQLSGSIGGGSVIGTQASDESSARWNAGTWPDDQWCEVSVNWTGSPDSNCFGPAVRVNASGDGYYFLINKNNGSWWVAKLIGGDYVSNVSSGFWGFSSAGSARLRLEVRGSILRAFIDGVEVGGSPFTDTTYASGKPGLVSYGNSTQLEADDWTAGGYALVCKTTVSGTLESGAAALAGSLAATSSVSGALSTSIRAAASLASVSTITASLTTAIRPAANLASVSTLNAAITTAIKTVAAPAASSTLTAALTTAIAAAAAPASLCTISADLTAGANGAIAATPSAVTTLTGALTTSIRPAAALSAASAVTADLTTGIQLACSIAPDDALTVLLLHADGTNGSTTFTDSSVAARTVTPNGNAQISTAQSKFGGTSAAFDGTGDYLLLADHADLDFSTADWTIEAFVRLTGSGSVILYSKSQNSVGAYAAQLWYNSSNTRFECRGFSSAGIGGGLTYDISTGSASVTTGQWYHVAVSRLGTTVRIFLDGVLKQTATAGSSTLYNDTQTAAIGAYNNGVSSLNGHIDEFRLTKGLARYTSTFTPPAAPFDGSVGVRVVAALTGTAAALAATPSAQSAATGALTTAIRPAASAASVVTLTADLTSSGAAALAATPVALVTATGALTTAITPAAAPVAVCSVTAALTVGSGLATAATTACTVSAALTTAIRPAADAATATAITAALTTFKLVATTPAAAATITAALTTAIRPASAATAQATITGALTTAVRLASSSSAATTISATLTTAFNLTSAPAAQSAATGALTAGIRPAATAQCAVTISAALGTASLFSAAVTSSTTIVATLTSTLRVYGPARDVAYVLADEHACTVAVQEVMTVAADTNAIAVLQDNRTSNVDRTDALIVPADTDEVTP